MDAIISTRPLFAIGVSLVALLLVAFTGEKRPNLREFWTISAGVIKFLLVVSMIPTVLGGKVFTFHLVTVLPGLEVAFKVDSLGLAFAATASFLWVLTTFYSIGYMRSHHEPNQTRFYISFCAAMSAVIGAAFAANMFTLFLFYEVITLCTFPLVAHNQTATALNGARKYLVYLLGTSLAFLLFAIFLTYNAAGTLDFTPGGILAGKGSPLLLSFIFILFMAGITKAAIMPLHGWLPAAMVAPTPVSAFLHAVAVVKVGVFTVIRVVLYIFGTDLLETLDVSTVLVYFACFTMLAASVMAIKQTNLKARLAYSTVSQLSYIVLGVALLTESGITGSVAHLTNHAFAKITLFFCAGSFYIAAHKSEIRELAGIGRKMPYTVSAFAIGVFGMIGVPLTGGFVTKWYLAVGSMEAGMQVVVLILMISTVLNAVYFVPILYSAFFREPIREEGDWGDYGHDEHIKENPFIVVPLMITAIISLLLGIFPSVVLSFAKGLL
jgi:multicomponent Na+:H+ antiporter subunit D